MSAALDCGRRLRTGQTIHHRQRGVASLVVVLALFFIVSLVAAYANRNLIFEQRTSANQLRSTLAFETAEAGVEWAVALLNSGLIDANCTPVDNDGSGTQTSFRQRYLTIQDNGSVASIHGDTSTPPLPTPTGPHPTCVNDGSGWRCACPSAGNPAIANPPAGVVAPAFRVRLVQRPASRPGTIWLEVNACTRLDDACLQFPAAGTPAPPAPVGDARARAEVMLVLKNALPSPPVAALTARGDVAFTGTTFTVANPAASTVVGLAVHAGGSIAPVPVLQGAPGETVDPARLVVQDAALTFGAVLPSSEQPDRFFAASLGALPAVYRDQPAVLRPECAAAACTREELVAALRRNPGRILWVDRSVNLGAGALGTAAEPVFLVMEGANRTLTLNGTDVHGVVFARSDLLTVDGDSGTLRGAVISQGGIQGSSGAPGIAVLHDADVLTTLRWRHGSFVRVPGSWRDY